MIKKIRLSSYRANIGSLLIALGIGTERACATLLVEGRRATFASFAASSWWNRLDTDYYSREREQIFVPLLAKLYQRRARYAEGPETEGSVPGRGGMPSCVRIVGLHECCCNALYGRLLHIPVEEQ